MTTEQLGRPDEVSVKRSPWLPVALAVGAVLLGLIVYNARYGAVSARRAVDRRLAWR